ncbi:MAG: hypothetical protein JSV19_04550 [Phycisphaerales bacterium]|nr:MAG: hypothetical protein JSV19_04550 [Phycisphaerales bacterium]
MTIDYDIPCVACRYNLRGLHPDGLCPECAVPIAHSVSGAALYGRSRNSLLTMRAGVTYLRWGVVGALVSVLLSVFIVPFLLFVFNYALLGLVVSSVLWFFGPILAHGLVLLGVYRITVKEEDATSSEGHPACPRAAIRILGVVGFVGIIVSAACVWSGAPRVFAFAGWLMEFAGVGMIFLLLRYLAGLAQCARDSSLVRSTTVVGYGMTVALQAVLVFTFLGRATGFPSHAVALALFALISAGVNRYTLIGGFGNCVAGVLCIALAVWALSILKRYREVFDSAAERAEEQA